MAENSNYEQLHRALKRIEKAQELMGEVQKLELTNSSTSTDPLDVNSPASPAFDIQADFEKHLRLHQAVEKLFAETSRDIFGPDQLEDDKHYPRR